MKNLLGRIRANGGYRREGEHGASIMVKARRGGGGEAVVSSIDTQPVLFSIGSSRSRAEWPRLEKMM